MNKTLYRISLLFSLLFLQVLVFNKVLFLGVINPYFYIVFVFLYPFRENRFSFLLLAFLLGLGVDFFSDTGGIHAFSTLLIAYIRVWFFQVVFKKNKSDYLFFNLTLETPGKIFSYTAILTLIHHFVLFSLINFGFDNFLELFIKTICSSAFTLGLFLLVMGIFNKMKQ